jgi:hypothetical protein
MCIRRLEETAAVLELVDQAGGCVMHQLLPHACCYIDVAVLLPTATVDAAVP